VNIKNVALYSRVSTKDRGQDCENQLAQLREFAAKQHWVIFHEYVDHASGSRSDREQFQQMFADASKRKFDLLLFWSLDRLSREGVLETLQHLQRLTGYGVGWRSYTEQFLDSVGPFRDAVLAILACLAKQERIRISERTRAGLDVARAKGKRLGRPERQIDPVVVRSLRAEGVSLAAIAKRFDVSVGTAFKAAKGKS
jgi:DNA invertase Pin-like site-specific DNA recombinase